LHNELTESFDHDRAKLLFRLAAARGTALFSPTPARRFGVSLVVAGSFVLDNDKPVGRPRRITDARQILIDTTRKAPIESRL
jgi:hypothetical protein